MATAKSNTETTFSDLDALIARLSEHLANPHFAKIVELGLDVAKHFIATCGSPGINPEHYFDRDELAVRLGYNKRYFQKRCKELGVPSIPIGAKANMMLPRDVFTAFKEATDDIAE